MADGAMPLQAPFGRRDTGPQNSTNAHILEASEPLQITNANQVIFSLQEIYQNVIGSLTTSTGTFIAHHPETSYAFGN
jgi:hypothetical protein